MPLSNRQLAAVIARRKAGARPQPRRIRRSPKAAIVAATTPNFPLSKSLNGTEVTVFSHDVHIVHFAHLSVDMEEHIGDNVDAMFGVGTFARCRPAGRFMSHDEGGYHDDPLESYILIVPRDVFEAR